MLTAAGTSGIRLLTAAACTGPPNAFLRSATRVPSRVRMQFISSVPPELPSHLQEMHEALSSGEAQLFDVREPREHAMGMLACAEPVPLSMLEQGMLSNGVLDKEKTTYLHCAAGIRVHPAAAILQQQMGFQRVIPLQEGFASLYNLGFPLAQE